MKNKKNNLIYFEISETDYPPILPFTTWMQNSQFRNIDWITKNKLSVVESVEPETAEHIFCVTAPRDWVETNCPSLLREDIYYCPLPEDENVCYGKNDIRFLNYNEGYKYV